MRAVIALALLATACGRREPEPPPFNLASASIALPADEPALPAGPHADLVAARCTACHSADMMLNQPPLSGEQWKATLAKMRDVYRAEVPASDEPAILAYLATLSATRAKEPS